MGVNSLPKTVTRQRRGYDLNPGPSAPESSTLTTRLPSHPDVVQRTTSVQRATIHRRSYTSALNMTLPAAAAREPAAIEPVRGAGSCRFISAARARAAASGRRRSTGQTDGRTPDNRLLIFVVLPGCHLV